MPLKKDRKSLNKKKRTLPKSYQIGLIITSIIVLFFGLIFIFREIAAPCPYLLANIPDRGQYYTVVEYECSFRDPTIRKGEELSVMLPSSTESDGRLEFEQLLYLNKLKKSDTLRITFLKVNDRIPTAGPEMEKIQADYYSECPLEKTVRFEGSPESHYYSLNKVFCSATESIYFHTDIEGEEAIVEIYTADPEKGKNEFKSWLQQKNLYESEKLRIHYIHIPNNVK